MTSLAGLPTPGGGTYQPYIPTAGKTPSWDTSGYIGTPQYPSASIPPSGNVLFGGIGAYSETPKAPSTAPTFADRQFPASKTSGFTIPRTIQPAKRATTSAPSLPYGSMTTWKPGKGAYGKGITKPTYATPTYKPPAFDQARISSLQEELMGAPMGQLRRGLQQSLVGSRYIENPNVRAMMERETMGGYGQGIASIRGGAGGEAYNRYMPEYQGAVSAAQTQFGADVQGVQTQFQADLEQYLKSGSMVTTPLKPSDTSLSSYRIPRIS